MAKRKKVIDTASLENMPLELNHSPRPNTYQQTVWYEPGEKLPLWHEQSNDEGLQTFYFFQARRRFKQARLAYLATLTVKPNDVTVGEFLSAHGIKWTERDSEAAKRLKF